MTEYEKQEILSKVDKIFNEFSHRPLPFDRLKIFPIEVGGQICPSLIWWDDKTSKYVGKLYTSDPSLMEMCLFFYKIPTNHGDMCFTSMEQDAQAWYCVFFEALAPSDAFIRTANQNTSI